MTIQHLLYVLRITETGSFNRAAESLFMAQPSLTAAVKELEKEIENIETEKRVKTIMPKKIYKNKLCFFIKITVDYVQINI